MRGVGWVYEQYASGRVESDEEVALTFAPDAGYRALTVPLINLRWAAQQSWSEAQLSQEEEQEEEVVELLAFAQAIDYRERSWGRLLHESQRAGERFLGSVALTRITRGVCFDCSLSYALRASHEGTGLRSEAVRAVIRHAFVDLGLHRIEAAHAPDNARRRLLERMGVEPVGTIRGFLLSGSGWRDTVLHSPLKSRWRPR